jgi:translation initiation factor 2B subunit (eIF-2B alpha/beta/delta family)/8-oxo-dGTP pyrophosphatase MutT (NUDIX family)
METRPVVTCFLRHEGEVLLLLRSHDVGTYPGLWGAVAGHDATADEHPTVPADTPADAAFREVAEETGLETPTLVRAGEPHEVVAEARSVRWRVHPFLFEVGRRAITTNEETASAAWVHPPELLQRETVPGLWRSYDRVRPRVATIRDDRTHGSTWLSVRALELLRDEAALAAADRDPEDGDRGGNDWAALAAFARDLRRLRPSMAVLTNRVNRAMHAAADEARPGAVRTCATDGIERAVRADREAAANAVAHVPAAVGTISRSETVTTALRERAPDAVVVAESRPGGEGVPVAAELATRLPATTAVTLTTDAAFPALLAERRVGALVVGADRILPDGDVLNKVGTRAAALSAHDDCDCLVVAASDKIARDDAVYVEECDPGELYDGDAPVAVANPAFDVTPARAIDAVVTEWGVLPPGEVGDVAVEHARRAEW